MAAPVSSPPAALPVAALRIDGPAWAVGVAAFVASLVPAMLARFVDDTPDFLLLMGSVFVIGLGAAWAGLRIFARTHRQLPMACLVAAACAWAVAAAALLGGFHGTLPFHAVYQAVAWLAMFALSWLAWIR